MSEKMADAMTLEGVRDWHRGCEQAANADGHIRAAAAHKQLADSIDAAIAPQRGLLCGTTPDGRPYALRGTPESVDAVSDLIEQATDQDARDAARLQALISILPTRSVLDEWLDSDLFGDGDTEPTLNQFRSAIDVAMTREGGR